MRRKYQLPAYESLDQIKIDLPKLQKACDEISNKFIDVMTANPALCENHAELVKNVYDNFEQINLTELDGPPLEFTDNIKERIRRKEEALYKKPTEDFIDSYFQEITDQFLAPVMRVRITKLAPQTEIPMHIDYDPTYAVRIIVPIYTNFEVKNAFKVRNHLFDTHLEAGKAYFLNTGFAHAVYNNSDKPRIALMFSLDGQDDLAAI